MRDRGQRGSAFLAVLARTHASRPPLQGLYSLTDSMILNFAWWIRASWWIRGSMVHQINPIARIHHGNFAAYRFNKHSFTRRPCQHGTASARLGRPAAGAEAPAKGRRGHGPWPGRKRRRRAEVGAAGGRGGSGRADQGRGRTGPAGADQGGGRRGRGWGTASSGIVISGPGAGADAGMKRFRGNVRGKRRHDAEETADARDTTA